VKTKESEAQEPGAPKSERNLKMGWASYILIIVAIVGLGLLAALVGHDNNSSLNTANKILNIQSNSPSPSLSLDPSSKTVAQGTTFKVQVWADTYGHKVNAVQANIAYPADKLQYVSDDTTNSSFTINAQHSVSSGAIYIARGNIEPVTGRALVATITFKSLASSGQAQVGFMNGSVIADSTTNTNVLGTTNNAIYTLTNY
jgi:plastocyanin